MRQIDQLQITSRFLEVSQHVFAGDLPRNTDSHKCRTLGYESRHRLELATSLGRRRTARDAANKKEKVKFAQAVKEVSDKPLTLGNKCPGE